MLSIVILTPTYNSANYLQQCIDSVVSKKSKDLTHIILDNCSTDQTLDIAFMSITNYKNIKIISQADAGVASALNFAIKNCINDVDVVGWLNSDDIYAPNAIDTALEAFIRDPKLSVVYGQANHIDSDGNFLNRYPVKPPSVQIREFLKGNFICQPAFFIKKDALFRVGLLNEKLRTAFDYDLFIRVFKQLPRKQIIFLTKVLAYSRLHQDCLTMKLRDIVAYEGMFVNFTHFGFSQTHWVLTYFEELYLRYPFFSDNDTLISKLKLFLSDIKSFLTDTQLKKLLENFEKDIRLKFSLRANASLSIYSDGWAGKKLIIKFRYSSNTPNKLILLCKKSWPISKNRKFYNKRLTLNIRSSHGTYNTIKIDTNDFFKIELIPLKIDGNGFCIWTIDTKSYFIPSLVNKQSKDKRHLSFLVNDVSLS